MGLYNCISVSQTVDTGSTYFLHTPEESYCPCWIMSRYLYSHKPVVMAADRMTKGAHSSRFVCLFVHLFADFILVRYIWSLVTLFIVGMYIPCVEALSEYLIVDNLDTVTLDDTARCMVFHIHVHAFYQVKSSLCNTCILLLVYISPSWKRDSDLKLNSDPYIFSSFRNVSTLRLFSKKFMFE